MPYVAPLWLASHLPHKGGDQLISGVETANLPTCGGDVRQDRGGQRRALTANDLTEGTRAWIS
jgi:hypothetical protein